MGKPTEKNTNGIKIFTLEKLMGNQIYNQKKRERRSGATVAGNEIF
jgi:hypothetical protein